MLLMVLQCESGVIKLENGVIEFVYNSQIQLTKESLKANKTDLFKSFIFFSAIEHGNFILNCL